MKGDSGGGSVAPGEQQRSSQPAAADAVGAAPKAAVSSSFNSTGAYGVSDAGVQPRGASGVEGHEAQADVPAAATAVSVVKGRRGKRRAAAGARGEGMTPPDVPVSLPAAAATGAAATPGPLVPPETALDAATGGHSAQSSDAAAPLRHEAIGAPAVAAGGPAATGAAAGAAAGSGTHAAGSSGAAPEAAAGHFPSSTNAPASAASASAEAQGHQNADGKSEAITDALRQLPGDAKAPFDSGDAFAAALSQAPGDADAPDGSGDSLAAALCQAPGMGAVALGDVVFVGNDWPAALLPLWLHRCVELSEQRALASAAMDGGAAAAGLAAAARGGGEALAAAASGSAAVAPVDMSSSAEAVPAWERLLAQRQDVLQVALQVGGGWLFVDMLRGATAHTRPEIYRPTAQSAVCV